ncbi:hypothetical protein LZK80_07965 [Rhizobium leguminosarum]|nr:hypothetical protein LZK80_07965 [Rhizobium leguminosarum]
MNIYILARRFSIITLFAAIFAITFSAVVVHQGGGGAQSHFGASYTCLRETAPSARLRCDDWNPTRKRIKNGIRRRASFACQKQLSIMRHEQTNLPFVAPRNILSTTFPA